ncbi:MAG TPA: hypothetical protein VKQ27_13345 [Acetobacteraceae bacterium]|nr:hypothetical protein [Acetobacteraceae bacterium]
MTTLLQQIEELRAELRGSYMSRRERTKAEAELARMVAEQAALDQACDRALAAYRQQWR